MAAFLAPISEEIWDRKYRLRGADGRPVDGTLDDTFWRVARAAAVPEQVGRRAGEPWAERVTVYRTARRLMEGFVRVP